MAIRGNGGPVLEITTEWRSRWDGDTGGYAHVEASGGLSLRDYFAIRVAAGIYANPREDYSGTTREDKAVEAYRMADAMLKAREG